MKVESYKVTINGRTPYDSPTIETRYRCVDEETGAVLDDAQGYGYKSAQNAHKAWAYKSNPKNRRKNGKIIKRKKELTEKASEIIFYALKDGASEKEIDDMIKEHPEWIKEVIK